VVSIMTHGERLTALLHARLVAPLLRIRRHVLSALALLFVAGVVLLALDARLPFPRPGERILYNPADWSLLIPGPRRAVMEPPRSEPAGGSMGGGSTVQAPLGILLYRATPGDTLGSIAAKVGLTMDTVSSLNRVQGRGVHNVRVGEVVKIPTEDGIFLTLAGDFNAMCEKRKVAPEDVLSANGLTRDQLTQGVLLFFPGVQHTGFELALAKGVGVALPLHGYESSAFGRRTDPFSGLPSRHSGVDIAAPEGSPIRSGTDGRVIRAQYDGILGNYVQIQGQVGFSYVYGHMSQILARVGAVVSTGQVIGLVGHTGYATGPHLHFEIRKNGVPINPNNYLPGIR
jgi:murein DD-endopeptidase MepM/ murein hydrolase activator NlpD